MVQIIKNAFIYIQNLFLFLCLDIGGSDVPGIQGDFIILQRERERMRLQTPAWRESRKPVPCSAPTCHPVSAEDENNVTSKVDRKAAK